VIDGLIRVMERVHAERGVRLSFDPPDPGLAFAGEAQDLQEILGNVLDNACKWSRKAVHVAASASVEAGAPRLRIVVEDDGPGITPERRASVMARGVRLDESMPGSGLGLAIVNELVDLYGGRLILASAAAGGLRVELILPAASNT